MLLAFLREIIKPVLLPCQLCGSRMTVISFRRRAPMKIFITCYKCHHVMVFDQRVLVQETIDRNNGKNKENPKSEDSGEEP